MLSLSIIVLTLFSLSSCELTNKVKQEYKRIKHHYEEYVGESKREDLPKIIQEQQIDIFLIPSIWTETFSYTTQEIIMMELPLMVFDLGAPAERVRKYKKGIIIEEINADLVIRTLQNTINKEIL